MKKIWKVCKTIIWGAGLSLLFGCNNADMEDAVSIDEPVSSYIVTNDDCDYVNEEEYDSQSVICDNQQQLVLLAEQYDEWFKDTDYFDNQYTYIAVADLNRNGRLEIIVSNMLGTNMLGTGCSSRTAFFEVNETFDSVERLWMSNDLGGFDFLGDFINAEELSCYKIDDKYYYELEDYNSSGWGTKICNYFWYSFDEEISNGLIAGYSLSPDENYESNIIYVHFCDDESNYLSEVDYNNKLIDFWSDYEKQPNVKLKWVLHPSKDECLSILQDSYSGYDESYSEYEISKMYYKDIYGEDYEYMIKDDISSLKNEKLFQAFCEGTIECKEIYYFDGSVTSKDLSSLCVYPLSDKQIWYLSMVNNCVPLDLDFDGEDEFILYEVYGYMCFDCKDGKVICFANGAGTSAVCDITEYDGAYWIVHEDVQHMGRLTYELRKYNGELEVVDSFEIGTEDWDGDGVWSYYIDDKTLSEEEYEELMAEIFE